MKPESVSEKKKTFILGLIEEARRFRFCGPSDDPDEQTAVTSGYRYLTVQFKRLAAPLLSASAASRLEAIDVEIDNLYSAYDAKAELDALLPEIEAALEQTNNNASPLPVPVCSVVGDVLGSYVAYHKPLERLFYDAGAVGDVPVGNCVIKCQTWLKRLHEEVADPMAVLGKVLEVFMEVDDSYRSEEQEKGRSAINDVLSRFGLSYRVGGIILGASSALPTKSLIEVLKSHDMAAVEKEFERSLANLESDPPASVTRPAAFSNHFLRFISKKMNWSCRETRVAHGRALGIPATGDQSNRAGFREAARAVLTRAGICRIKILEGTARAAIPEFPHCHGIDIASY